jgi:hypothetical protein
MTESPRKNPERNRYFLSSFLRKTKRLRVERAVRIQSIESEFIMREMPSKTGDRPIKIVANLAVWVPNNFFIKK